MLASLLSKDSIYTSVLDILFWRRLCQNFGLEQETAAEPFSSDSCFFKERNHFGFFSFGNFSFGRFSLRDNWGSQRRFFASVATWMISTVATISERMVSVHWEKFSTELSATKEQYPILHSDVLSLLQIFGGLDVVMVASFCKRKHCYIEWNVTLMLKHVYLMWQDIWKTYMHYLPLHTLNLLALNFPEKFAKNETILSPGLILWTIQKLY